MVGAYLRPPNRSGENWEWRIEARCRTEDPSLFFHPDGERGNDRQRRQQLARQVCSVCPVMLQCREHAIAFQEGFGTWGGLSEDERARLLQPAAVHIRTHRHG